ncbi:proteasome subunit alpha type-1-like [Drosophila miranda]|uniref:proteasome subunit alpha type-1-like n=1 Tax=Drosophila miranda TaxID=7229 RepID=UPI0007E6B5B7|nr:proteasome subunit alpha type-1-like [Drosophila miranda]
MEAVKQGSTTVGVKGRDFVVLVALTTASGSSVAMRKIIAIDEHLGISIYGISENARELNRYLRLSCINYRYTYETGCPVKRLIGSLGYNMQATIKRCDGRPYQVGLLVAGYDKTGPHLYQVMTSGVINKCQAQSIGEHSQGARTYLERNINTFLSCSDDQLICHALLGLQNSQPVEGTSSGQENAPALFTTTVAIVGKDQLFKLLTVEEVKKYIEMAKEMGATAQTQPPSNPDDEGNNGDNEDDADPQPDVATMEN